MKNEKIIFKRPLYDIVILSTLFLFFACSEDKIDLNTPSEIPTPHVAEKPSPLLEDNFKVIGYLRPSGYPYIDQMDLSRTTHINLSFSNIGTNGKLVLKGDISDVISRLHKRGVKVFIVLGGGAISDEEAASWRRYLQANQREQLITSLVKALDQYGFDGYDLDFENTFLKSIGNNFNLFVVEFKQALKDRGLSAAFPGGWLQTNVSNKALSTLDFINVMAYDQCGPWTPDKPGQHSPLSLLNSVENFWVKRKGVDRKNIVFGLPFYGYNFGGGIVRSAGWSKIISNSPENAYVDQVGALWYNGIPTIAKKTQISLSKFGGVMVWSYGLDCFNDMSLIKTINQVVKAGYKEGEEIKTFYVDNDGDGYGDIRKPFQAYSAPKGYVNRSGDGDDNNASVHP
ncbi:glycosyl hydrolase family 18 protein [Prolixibacteraceae bacterium]|nr:glycosyl hydrolase family 18 protein [Prolixibacteraceae bacterium]